jgi:hypothetical protein
LTGIEVRVTAASSGTPVGNALIEAWLARGACPEGQVAWSDGPGRVVGNSARFFAGVRRTDGAGNALLEVLRVPESLGPVHVRVSASCPGFVEDFGAVHCLDLPRIGETAQLSMTLQEGRILRGRLLGLDPGDQERVWPVLQEAAEKEGGWYTMPTVGLRGEFTTKTAPRVPLRLLVEDLRGKYRPMAVDVASDFDGPIEISLERNPGYVAGPVAAIKPVPPNGTTRLNYMVGAISCLSGKVVQGVGNELQIKAVALELPEAGEYEAFVICLEEPAFAGRQRFVVPTSGRTEVSVRLEKAATIRLNLFERAGGGKARIDDVTVSVLVEVNGEFRRVATMGGAALENEARTSGTMTLRTIPPGHVQLRVEGGPSGKYPYTPWTASVRVASGEVLTLDAPLDTK